MATGEKPQTPRIIEPSGGDPTFAIAFGGGGARGYAHIHIIEALDDMGIRPVAISGASIGAIMGSCMAAGMSGQMMREYVLEMMSNRAELLSRFWAARPSGFADMMDGGLRLGQFKVERVIKAFLPDGLPATFEDLVIPMSVIGTDFYAHSEAVFESGDLISAIGASAALPAVFKPVKRNGRIYIDGGIFNPVPYEHLFGKADIVVGIDVVGAPLGDDTQSPTAMDSIYGASQLMMQSILQAKMLVKAPDVFIMPPVSRFRVMDFLKARQILEETQPVRDELKRKIETAFEAHRLEHKAGG